MAILIGAAAKGAAIAAGAAAWNAFGDDLIALSYSIAAWIAALVS